MFTKFFPGPRVRTPVFSGRVLNEPSVMVMRTFTKMVTLFEPPGPLLTPNFHVCVPPVFARDSLWVHCIWVMSGGAHPTHVCWTRKEAVVLWLRPGLVPVTLKT